MRIFFSTCCKCQNCVKLWINAEMIGLRRHVLLIKWLLNLARYIIYMVCATGLLWHSPCCPPSSNVSLLFASSIFSVALLAQSELSRTSSRDPFYACAVCTLSVTSGGRFIDSSGEESGVPVVELLFGVLDWVLSAYVVYCATAFSKFYWPSSNQSGLRYWDAAQSLVLVIAITTYNLAKKGSTRDRAASR